MTTADMHGAIDVEVDVDIDIELYIDVAYSRAVYGQDSV